MSSKSTQFSSALKGKPVSSKVNYDVTVRRSVDTRPLAQTLYNEARTGSSLNGFATKSTSQTSLKAGPITDPYPLQNEYIKNLQHQIYLLELEVEYLRDQARKSVSTHPVFVEDAERMLKRLRELQNAGDNLKVSLLSKETAIARVERERDLLKERLSACEGSNSGEMRLIADDGREHRSELQRLKGLLERTRFALDQKRSDLGLLLAQIQDAELKIEEIRTQIEERASNKNTQLVTLEEKKSELKRLEQALQELESQRQESILFTNHASSLNNTIAAEMEQVLKRLEEAEKKRDGELALRERVQQEFTKLLNENIEIKQRINAMHRVLDVKSSDRRVEMASGQRELNQIQETCSRLEQKLGALRAELKGEELRASTLLEDLSQRQRLLASASASAAPASASASTRVVSGMRHTHAAFSSSAVLRREQSALLASASGARRPSAEAFAPSGSGLVRFQLSGSAKQALSTRPVAGGADLSTSQYALRTSASQRLAALGGTSRAGDLLDGRGGGAVSDVLSQAEQQKLENEQLRAEIASLVQKVSSLQQELDSRPTDGAPLDRSALLAERFEGTRLSTTAASDELLEAMGSSLGTYGASPDAVGYYGDLELDTAE